jgi:hypothetical protein
VSRRGRRALAILAAVALCACASPATVPPRAALDKSPAWEDAFVRAPDLIVAFHPRALRRDPIYGALLDKALALLRSRNRVVTATRAIDVIEDADEVIFGMTDRGHGDDPAAGDDMVAVILGVRADIDPAALVDGSGRPLWSPGQSERVRELVREKDEDGESIDASLFELPGRAWVMASGAARARLRDAWARPHLHAAPPALPSDDEAIAFARLDGPSLVARLPWLRQPAALAPVGRRLRSLTLEVPPGATDVHARFVYADDASAAAAEARLEDAVVAIHREKPEGIAWLGEARIARHEPGSVAAVGVTAPLPARWVEVIAQRAAVPAIPPAEGSDSGADAAP